MTPPHSSPGSPHPAAPVPREPLAWRTAARLEEELRRGTWRGLLPGERELAKILQVSRMTLRDALLRLEEKGRITSGRGRRRIILPAPHPDAAGQTGDKRPSTTEVVFLTPIPLQEMEFNLLTIIHFLTHSLAQHGTRLTVSVRPSCYSQRPEKAIAQLVDELAPEGWLLFRVTEPMQNWFHRHRQRTIIIGNAFGPDTPALMSQHEAVSRHAASQFQRLKHRRVAIILPRHEGAAVTDRAIRDGFSQAAPDLPITFCFHDRSRENILSAVDKALAHRETTGLFSVGGQYSLLVLTRLLQLGLRLPDDLSLLIWGDDPSFQYLCPEPAYYEHPVERSARQLFRLVRRVLIEREHTPLPARLIPELKPGNTLGAARTAQWLPVRSPLV